MKPLQLAEKLFDKNRLWHSQNDNQTLHNKQTKENFAFDRVYNESMSTADIFNTEAKKLVLSALDGYNVTIFAYGQTSSGKTYTMRGSNNNLGIIPLALNEIFHALNHQYGQSYSTLKDNNASANMKRERSWNVKVSYLEIYNECVNDLLDPTKKNLDIRESRQQGIYIDQLSQFEVSSLEETMGYLNQGDEQRIIAETKLNEKSSRSHTVFKIDILVSERNLQTGRNSIKSSQINLVDLAGSEGVSKTKSEGMRFREGANINKSLLALSNVICKLGQKFQSSQKNYYINFRDSKLTRILQQALSGNSQTAIICTISQLFNNYQESRETLNFGAKAKNIKTIVNLNEIVKESPDEIAQKMLQLSKENNELRLKLKSQEDFVEMIERDKEEYGNTQNGLCFLKQHLEYLNRVIDERNCTITQKENQILKQQDQFDAQLADVNDQTKTVQTELILLKEDKQKLEVRVRSLKDKISQILSKNDMMNDVYDVRQKSILEISNTSLLSNTDQRSREDVDLLKSTIQSLSLNNNELLDKYNELQVNYMNRATQCQQLTDQLVDMIQQLKEVKFESRKKDKYISKKNFQITNLQTKIDCLERQSQSLFKDLDQTLQGISIINNNSGIDNIEDYMNSGDLEMLYKHSNESKPSFRPSLESCSQQPSNNEQNRLSIPKLTQKLIDAQQKAQLTELQTRIEILENEKLNLEQHRDQCLQDLEEAEHLRDHMGEQLRDLDSNMMSVIEENEELQERLEKMMSTQNLDELTTQNQRDQIQRYLLDIKNLVLKIISQESEIEGYKKSEAERFQTIDKLKQELESLKRENKKRKREEISHQEQSTNDATHMRQSKRLKANQDTILEVNNESGNFFDDSKYSSVNFYSISRNPIEQSFVQVAYNIGGQIQIKK